MHPCKNFVLYQPIPSYELLGSVEVELPGSSNGDRFETMEEKMQVFRLHIRPYGGAADIDTTFAYCLKNSLLGVGWRVDIPNTRNWSEYYEAAAEQHGDVSICQYIRDNVAAGDLLWTRDLQGRYYLARVDSPWEYWQDEEARKQDIDIANIVRCHIVPVPIDEVPGKIVACFRPSRTIQAVRDSAAVEYSKFLWNKHSGKRDFEIDEGRYQNLFMMLDDQETEDLFFLYLQSLGWYVVPHTRKADTMSFEFMVVRPDTGDTAWTQVKTGNTTLDRNSYASYEHQVILFQANDLYSGEEHATVSCVSTSEIRRFMEENIGWLPRVFANKLEMLSAA